MSDTIAAVFVILGAYMLGSIPWGYIIGRIYGVDVRTVGSKNIGATNVTRTVGRIPGKICFVLDFLKGGLPVLAGWYVGTQSRCLRLFRGQRRRDRNGAGDNSNLLYNKNQK